MTENDYKLLDRYLAGELTATEQQEVESRLKNDKDFAEAYAFRQSTERFLRTKEHEPALREILTELGPRYFGDEAAGASPEPPATEVKTRRLWPRLLTLAAVLALLLLAWQPWAGERDLYAEYAEHPPLNFTTRSETPADWQAVETAWEAGDYEAAYQAFGVLPDSTQRQVAVKFARGISALETERYAEAQLLFRSLAEGQSAYRDYGAWYEALTQLKAGNKGTARQLLHAIEPDDPQLQAKVEALRKELD